MVKGLKTEDELETTNSDKSWNESEATDSEEPNQLKAKRTRRQRKSTPTRRNRRVEKRWSRNSDGPYKQTSRLRRSRCVGPDGSWKVEPDGSRSANKAGGRQGEPEERTGDHRH